MLNKKSTISTVALMGIGVVVVVVSILLLGNIQAGEAVSISPAATCPSQPVWRAEGTKPLVNSFSLVDLINASNLIVDGIVMDIEFCRPVAEGSLPFTFISLKVNTVISGSYEGDNLIVYVAGGYVDGTLSTISNMLFFSKKDRIILFLGPGRLSSVVGYTDGIFYVSESGLIKNYYNQPIAGIDIESGRYHLDGRVKPMPLQPDPAYGGIKFMSRRDGEPPRIINGEDFIDVFPIQEPVEDVPLPLTLPGFIEAIKGMIKLHQIPLKEPGKLVPLGTPFQFGPIQTEPPKIVGEVTAEKSIGLAYATEADHE